MGDDLFSAARPAGPGGVISGGEAAAPLADRMRPRSLDEFIGQERIVGPGRLLRRAIQRDRLSSIILSGPPGTGKTTLARIIANTTKSRFLSINAVLSGVQAIREAIDSAKREREFYDRRTILFVDEVHRWNKAQQDALLPWVENGTILLIGATTENPYFEVNRALVSRSRVFQLESLSDDDLTRAAKQALADAERGYGRWRVEFEEGALEHLVKVAEGDARSLLNALELAVETSAEPWPPLTGERVYVTMATAEESIQRRAVLYDRDGDYHYDAASALIKSLRGSDPDAALYWLSRMVYAGEEPRFIFRRLLISAAEDVGLADPRAISVVESCAAAYERIGLPEGQFHLAQAALYLATAPKSNSTMSYFDALAAVEKERAEVPNHLKDASRDAQGFGHGAGYQYPHAYRGHWTAQQYLPDALRGAVFYRPGAQGFEGELRDEVLRRRDAQLAAWLEGAAQGPADADEAWSERLSQAAVYGRVRDELMELAAPGRHENVLILNGDDGLLAREATRRCADGSTTVLVRDEASLDRLRYAFQDTEELLRPYLGIMPSGPLSAAALCDASLGAASASAASASAAPANDTAGERGAHASFELIAAIGLLGLGADAPAILRAAFPAARLALAERMPAAAGLLPELCAGRLDEAAAAAFKAADAAFYAGGAAGPTEAALAAAVEGAGYRLVAGKSAAGVGERRLTERELGAWLSPSSAYGQSLAAALGAERLLAVKEALAAAAGLAVAWPWRWYIVAAAPAPAL